MSDESLSGIYESGTQGLLWRPDGVVRTELSAANDVGDFVDLRSIVETVDLDALLDSDEPAEAVAAVDPVVLYHSLQRRGPEDALEIIPHITSEQFTKIMDYEGWDRESLSLSASLRWLQACRSVSKETLFNKFISLEEEVQTGMLGNYIDFIEEEQYELLPDNEQDTYQQLPCRTSWWRIKTDDQEIRSIIEDMIDGGFGENMGYTYSLLAHASQLPPNEQEQMARQFRNARLEEDGFIPFEEAQLLFRGINASILSKKYGFADAQACFVGSIDSISSALVGTDSANDFFDQVLNEIKRVIKEDSSTHDLKLDPQLFLQTFAHLVNTVCSAVQVTPENEPGIKLVLVQIKGLVGAALDMLSKSDVREAVKIIAAEHPKDLFRFSLGVIDSIRLNAVNALRHAAIPAADKIERLWRTGRFGSLLVSIDTDMLETIGFESTETLKGLFNRFPMRPVSQRFMPDGDRRIVFRNLAGRADIAALAMEIDQIASTWRIQQ